MIKLVMSFIATFMFLLMPSKGGTDCVVNTTIVLTSPDMVNKMCWELGAQLSDDGEVISPRTHQILGCTNGSLVILPNNLDPEILAHELNHVVEINCPADTFWRRLNNLKKEQNEGK